MWPSSAPHSSSKHLFFSKTLVNISSIHEAESEISFERTMGALTAELAAQMRESAELDKEIKIQLAKVGFELEGGE